MQRVTRWSPDTCGCVIEYAWDDAQAEDVRSHDLHDVVERCAAHAALKPAEVWGAVPAENQTKNRVVAHLLENYPELTRTVVLEDGESAKVFAKGKAPELMFEGVDGKARTLSVAGLKLDTANLAKLQAALDADPAVGPVQVAG